ncbi:glycosyltransferase [Kosakonia oryziphila]|jgi:Predicted glycosyltransferases|uniref:Glycosyl transferase family 2 n=1 Tax=Kosakonia oryziphila TaxID=1005667 RepID=A0A1C4ALG3_9ENTR|nr:glycosyltransferase [Kosakonia oryziphila]SCB95388.1 Glycosyl transferase family 2 [Kosakonia oryziphila]
MLSEKANRCIINTMDYEGDVLLTIAIPTYKRFDLLKETLRSVFANDFKINIEVIVVDNDPDNDMLALQEMKEFERFQFKYYKNSENYGMFGNWNQCLMLAKGKYITLLHDDDLLKDNFSSTLDISRLEKDDFVAFNCGVLDERTAASKPRTHLLYSFIKKFYTRVREIKHKRRRVIDIKTLFFLNVFMGTLAVVFNRDKAIAIGGFDEGYYPVADYHFWSKWIVKFGTVYIDPEHVALYRIRENETMKQQTIDAFIEKDFQLREEICRNVPVMKAYAKYTNLLKQRDSMLFNFSWSNNEVKHKKNVINILKYFILRVRCAIFFTLR